MADSQIGEDMKQFIGKFRGYNSGNPRELFSYCMRYDNNELSAFISNGDHVIVDSWVRNFDELSIKYFDHANRVKLIYSVFNGEYD